MEQPNQQPSLELTVKAVVLGLVLSVLLAAANAYLGLFAGMTVSASIPAAVVSMGLLRLWRRHGILENNLVQTAASAGESLAAGAIFTLPALVLLNAWQGFPYGQVTLITALGGLLGVLFTIPLRCALVTQGPLRFPEGVATAEVLRSGARGGAELRPLALASLAGGLFKLAQAGLRLWPAAIETARRLGPTVAYLGTDLSPALLSVGYLVGLNIAVLIFLGGLANWLIAVPLCACLHPWPVGLDGQALPPLDVAGAIWRDQTRYIGVGAMVVGGLWTIIQLRVALVAGVQSGLAAYRRLRAEPASLPRTERDLPMPLVLALTPCAAVPLFLLYQYFVRNVPVSASMAVLMLCAGFLFSAVAAYLAGLVGSSNNPISGVTIATVLTASLLLTALLGRAAPHGPAAAILIGAVVCCAAAIAGDNIQDLKAGHILGATPARQQLMEILGVLVAALVLAPILSLLYRAYGFAGHASARGEAALAAVQANLMAAVARGVFHGQLPRTFLLIGAAAAVLLIVLDSLLERRGAAFRTPVLAVAIGFYLPFALAVPIFAGGLLHHAAHRTPRRTSRHASAAHSPQAGRGLLFASGLITGEALVGVLLAVPIVLTGRTDALALAHNPLGPWPGLVLLLALAAWFYRTARPRPLP